MGVFSRTDSFSFAHDLFRVWGVEVCPFAGLRVEGLRVSPRYAPVDLEASKIELLNPKNA